MPDEKYQIPLLLLQETADRDPVLQYQDQEQEGLLLPSRQFWEPEPD